MRRGFLYILFLLAFLFGSTRLVLSQTEPKLSLLPATVQIENQVADAILDAALEIQLPTNVTQIAVTSYVCPHRLCFASVLGFDSSVDASSWHFDRAIIIGLVAVDSFANDAAWQSSSKFEAWIADESLRVPALAQLSMNRSQRQTMTSITYDFPWTPNTSSQYGNAGVHTSGFVTGWKAVDWVSDGNTGAGHAPNKLLAAAPGVVSFVCDDGTSVAIRVGDLLYLHLLKNDKLRVGQNFNRGDEIGELRFGSFSNRCGYAQQQSNNFHVHLGFPDTGVFTMGGWALNIADGIWKRDDKTLAPNQWVKNDGCYNKPKGDANCDTRIDGIDYSMWLNSKCVSCANMPADFDKNNNVDDADYALWLTHRITQTSSGGFQSASNARVLVSLIPNQVDLDLDQLQKYDLVASVSNVSITETIDYARIALKIPTQTLKIPVSSTVVFTPGTMTLITPAPTIAQLNATGAWQIELGTNVPNGGLSITQPITLATFEVQAMAKTPLSTIAIESTQWVNNSSNALSATTQSANVSVEAIKTYLPIVSR